MRARNVARIDLHFVTQNVDPVFKWLLTPINLGGVEKTGELFKNFYCFVKKKKREKRKERKRKETRRVFRSLNLSTSFYRMCVQIKKYEFNTRRLFRRRLASFHFAARVRVKKYFSRETCKIIFMFHDVGGYRRISDKRIRILLRYLY